jgi:hypothetical protein
LLRHKTRGNRAQGHFSEACPEDQNQVNEDHHRLQEVQKRAKQELSYLSN